MYFSRVDRVDCGGIRIGCVSIGCECRPQSSHMYDSCHQIKPMRARVSEHELNLYGGLCDASALDVC
jgi:hypothetical protein